MLCLGKTTAFLVWHQQIGHFVRESLRMRGRRGKVYLVYLQINNYRQ